MKKALIVSLFVSGCGALPIEYGIQRQSMQCATPRAVYTRDIKLRGLLNDAIAEWNNVAAHNVLIVADTPDTIMVTSGGDYVQRDLAGATAWTSKDGCMQDAHIQISERIDGLVLANTLRHEIGHIMGLGHRDRGSGLMSDDHTGVIDRLPIVPGTQALTQDMYEVLH